MYHFGGTCLSIFGHEFSMSRMLMVEKGVNIQDQTGEHRKTDQLEPWEGVGGWHPLKTIGEGNRKQPFSELNTMKLGQDETYVLALERTFFHSFRV